MVDEIDIDPYIPRLPLGPWFTPDGRPTLEYRKNIEYQNKVIHDITQGVGTNQNNITNITSSETFETSSSSAEYHDLFEQLEQRQDFVHLPKEWKTQNVTTNYTAVDHDFNYITNGATVTLDEHAGHNAQIITQNGDGSRVKVYSATEIRFKGQSDNTIYINNNGTSLHWFMIVTDAEKFWVAS